MARRGRYDRTPETVPAWSVLYYAQGEPTDLIYGFSPYRQAVRERGPAAVAAGYLEVIDGRYYRTPLGDEYVLAKLDERTNAVKDTDEWKARMMAQHRRDLAEQPTAPK